MKRITTSGELRHLGQASDERGLIVPDQLPIQQLTVAQASRVRAEFVRGWPVGANLLRHFAKR